MPLAPLSCAPQCLARTLQPGRGELRRQCGVAPVPGPPAAAQAVAAGNFRRAPSICLQPRRCNAIDNRSAPSNSIPGQASSAAAISTAGSASSLGRWGAPMSQPGKPCIGLFPFVGRGFEAFVRRDLIVRVRFFASLTFLRLVKTSSSPPEAIVRQSSGFSPSLKYAPSGRPINQELAATVNRVGVLPVPPHGSAPPTLPALRHCRSHHLACSPP